MCYDTCYFENSQGDCGIWRKSDEQWFKDNNCKPCDIGGGTNGEWCDEMIEKFENETKRP